MGRKRRGCYLPDLLQRLCSAKNGARHKLAPKSSFLMGRGWSWMITQSLWGIGLS